MYRKLLNLPQSTEFSLLLRLAYPSPSLILPDIVSEIQNPLFNQQRFLHMVKWHRVTPQVYQTLSPLKSELPADLCSKLDAMNQRCRMKSLKMSAWLAKISPLLARQDIEVISLKGIGLSQQLYGNSGYREFNDIDILVRQEHVDITEAILFELGFVRIRPHADATPKQIQFLNQHRKDREYLHPDDGTMLELHWLLTPVAHTFNPSFARLLATTSLITVHGQPIATIGGLHLWLYQCLHGSASSWYRMRWICDIAQLLSFHQPDWDELLELADGYHCRNSLLEGVGLACTLFDLPVPERLQPLFQHNKLLQQNIAYSSNRLYHMKLKHGLPFLRRIRFWAPASSLTKHLLFHYIINEEAFKRVHLPDSLFFLYYLFSFLFRHINFTTRSVQ